MKIAINGRSFLKKQPTGIGRYAYHLMQSLSEIDRHNEYFLYVQKKLFDTKRRIPRIRANNLQIKVDWFNRGPEEILKGVDVYHAPSPEPLKIKNVKIVATIHDLIHIVYPQGHTDDTIKTLTGQISEIVDAAARIICCSHNTIKDLQSHFSVDPRKIKLIYQGVDKDTFCPLGHEGKRMAKNVLRAKGVEGDFLLFVGTIEPRKNLDNLLRAFSLLKRENKFTGKLVVAGMRGWKSEHLEDLIVSLGLTGEIIFLGYVSDWDLNYLYNLAKVFVFPSFYEGFGFPIIEAFTCGAAVVTSDVASCSEVAGDAAVKVNPAAPEQIAEGIRKIVEDEPFAQQIKMKGLRRAEDFSFLKTAQETLKVYEEVYCL
ncbi:MAG: glycosyltransferase family 1 protein [Candidatus Omnitrophota bacterium]